jgi:endoglucanase
MEYTRRFVAERKKLGLARDSFGNLLLTLPGRRAKAMRWVFTAHMDHPGFVSRGMVEKNLVAADFWGNVEAEYVEGCKVVFFDGEREIRGKVVEVMAEEQWAKGARVKVGEDVAAGTLGMFDLGEARIAGDKFYSRAIDDLGGCAAALAMMDELHADPPESTIALLLTRAEEEGFIGAIGASIRPKLLKKSDRIIAIETSAMQTYAPQGAGPIIRVGDRTSTFDSSLTYFLTQQAVALKKNAPGFEFQRALMPGGTCEATVYDVYGFRASSICVALGNYHNMDRQKRKLGPEYINVDDWRNMVKLFVAVARNGHEYREGHGALKEKIEGRFERMKKLLEERGG